MDNLKKIAYLSNVTADMVAVRLKKTFDVYLPDGYDTWISEVMNDSSPIYDCDAIFLILDGTELYGLSHEEVSKKVCLWENAVQALTAKATSYVFLSTIDMNESRIKSFGECREKSKWEYYWDNFIQNQDKSNIYCIDIKNRISDIGRDNFYSPKMWYMGSTPYSKAGIGAIVDEIRLAMNTAFELRRKIVVVDLDNTLWGGVIGEDGMDGIVLSTHNEGARYYDFQRRLLEMKQQGILLGINSKNNEEDAAEAFRHPNMVLQRDDFVCEKINWKDKALNIREMADELNLTEGSFVFLDDNPVERECVKQNCPEVIVPDFPTDTVDLPKWLDRVYREYFRPLHITGEDNKKTQMYQAEKKRRYVKEASLDLDSYIKLLEISVDIHKMGGDELERTHQLINKTNQFNLTTKRYSLGELRQKNKDPYTDIFTVHMADKFGDNGLVGVVIVVRVDSKAEIDTFLMSCRVMGRKIEDAILTCLVRYYKQVCERLTAVYIKTAKNKPVENLYEKMGFELITVDEKEKRYSLELKKDYNQFFLFQKLIFNGEIVDNELSGCR